MLLPLVACILSAAPGATTDVLLSRRVGLTQAKALVLADQISHALEADGIAVRLAPPAAAEQLARQAVPDTAACEGHADCIASLGGQLKDDVVIGVDLAQVSTELAVHLIALKVGPTPRKLAEDSLIVGPGAPNLEFGVRPFAHQLGLALAPPPEPATQAPLAQKSPNLIPSAGAVAPQSPAVEPPSKLPLYAAGSGAALSAGLSIYFLVSALHLEDELNSSRYTTSTGATASHLTRAEADDKVSSANRDNAIGIVGGVVAVGLFALTTHLLAGGSP